VTSRRTIRLPDWVDRLDESIDLAWEPLRGRPSADRLFYAASAAGDFSVIWHALNLARFVAGGADRREVTRLALALGVESVLVNQVIKRLFRRKRPVVADARPRRLRTPSTSSFPSGHASSATLAALLLSEKSRIAPVYGVVAAVVATSRLHVRIHHASDVAAGVVVGAAGAAVIGRFWPRR